MQLMHYGTPSFRFELIRWVKEILVRIWNSRLKKKLETYPSSFVFIFAFIAESDR